MANRRLIQQFESGLDELVSSRDRSQPHHGPHRLDEAAKRKWANCDLYEVWRLVALHSGADPDSLGTSPEAAICALRHSEIGDALQRLIGVRLETKLAGDVRGAAGGSRPTVEERRILDMSNARIGPAPTERAS